MITLVLENAGFPDVMRYYLRRKSQTRAEFQNVSEAKVSNGGTRTRRCTPISSTVIKLGLDAACFFYLIKFSQVLRGPEML